ncbi:hypothetical protein Desku_0839 [Desulfofundulus kuznetsovii DSM 6115]|uniref:Type II secretion system protein GspF domain-containing protein n=1 Tax=Desulfofundulus kuznetsovii (strain DSM 6115 / VKM B-1805 / 17) TaxID=760568 RepID=A0AAU8PUD6_DESK7|nr:hypothetical protein Desku_0839 [Desulfofundulus kuznetsovii DSM 6115]
MLLGLGLFACLLIAFILLCVSFDDHEVSPAALAVDSVKRRINARLTGGSRGEILAIIGKGTRDVLKTGIVTGFGLGLLICMVSFKFAGPFSLVLGFGGVVLGVILTGTILENEYRKWQGRLLDGVPTLVNFVPAFLEVEGVTPREALGYTIPFLPEPLRSEMWSAFDKIKRTSRVREAMDVLARKAKHPLIDAICFRLSAAWDTKITSDIFADLADQVDDIKEMAAARATAAKTGYLALICVLGLIGMMLIYGYPGFRFLMDKLTEGFAI